MSDAAVRALGLLLPLLLAFALAAPAPAVVLHVAPDGDDAAAGDSRATALASPAGARDRLRQLREAGGVPDGAEVLVHPGAYHLDATLEFGADDGGVVYRAATDEKPVLRGGRPLTGWQPYRDGILVCDLAALGWDQPAFGQLFFNGERMTLARTPNLDPTDPHGGVWAHVADGRPEDKRNFDYGKEIQPERWQHPEQARVHIFPTYDWRFNRLPVASVDLEARRITLGRDATYEFRPGDRFFVENLLEELDAPGEWYLDREAKRVYFLPPGPLDAGDVVAPVIDNLVALDGTRDLTLHGFVLEAGDGLAVAMANAERCRVEASELRNVGGWGVAIEGGRECAVVGCDIHHTGHGGVRVNGGDRETLTSAGHLVDNCHIHHIAVVERTYNTAINLSGVGNTASHNLIHDTPHAGMTLAGNENVVEYNHVHHTNLQSGDTGGIYSCPRDWTQRGNTIRYNLWHDIGGFGKENSWQPIKDDGVPFAYPHFTWGIYMDDPTSGNHIYGNVLYRVPISGLHNHGGRDNVFENNIIVDAPAFQAGALSADWSEWPRIKERYAAVCQPGSAHLQRYPELADYDLEHPEAMTGITFRRNILYYTTEGTAWLRHERAGSWGGEERQLIYTLRTRPADLATYEWDHNLIHVADGLEPIVSANVGDLRGHVGFEDWRKLGFDQNSVFADPLFVDAAGADFRLKPGSPAEQIGFEPIPLDEIGPYESPDRASWPVEAEGFETQPIRRHVVLPQYARTEAAPVHLRGGIANAAAKLAAGETVRVAYFGGGVHAPGGWRKSLVDALAARYPNATLETIDGSVTDATRGIGFSVYRFGHDVLAHEPDLVLVDFAADDHGSNPRDIQRALEGAVRQARRADPTLDMVFVYPFRSGFESDYAEGLAPSVVSAHERVAERYGIPSINLGLGVHARLTEGAALDTLMRNERTATELGEAAYQEAAAAGIVALADGSGAAAPHRLPEPLELENLERARQIAITPEMLEGEWQELPADDPLMRSNARHFDRLWYTNTPGAKLTFRFRGTTAQLYTLMGPDTGQARVTVDGKPVGTFRQVDPWAYYQRLSALTVASGLPDEEHTVTVELLPEPPDRRVAIEGAKAAGRYNAADFEGVALRLGGIRIVGDPVE